MKNNNTNYQVGDFLITLKNASMANNKSVKIAFSKKILALAEALKKAGFIEKISKQKSHAEIFLTFKNKKPVLQNVKLISKPGLRVYKTVAEIEDKKGPSILIISTPKGIFSTKEALKERSGGEVIAEIW